MVISSDDEDSDSDESVLMLEELRNGVPRNTEPANSHTPAMSGSNNQNMAQERALPSPNPSQADRGCKQLLEIRLNVNFFLF
jgi:hypothetical protein